MGDGFFVRTIFSPQDGADLLSPFLLLDFSPPRFFEPASIRRGVGEHPHRGFETVTFAFHGEVQHRDSAGGGGRIGPGDVQWMTAASGVVHEEKHSDRLTREGGLFSMAQLWVNLPANQKMSAPRYQPLLAQSFPDISLGPATGRLVAGELQGCIGPAQTMSPMCVMDVLFEEEGTARMEFPPGWNTLIVTLRGRIKVSDSLVAPQHAAVLDPDVDGAVWVEGSPDAQILVLAGQPLREPVVSYGPFVMNSWTEIKQAVWDYEQGRMGRLDSD